MRQVYQPDQAKEEMGHSLLCPKLPFERERRMQSWVPGGSRVCGRGSRIVMTDHAMTDAERANEPTSICDACGKAIHEDEGQACFYDCGGTFCEDHVGDLDHDCPNRP